MVNNKILGLIGLATKAGGICFGADSVKHEISKNKVKVLIVARDSSERTKNKFNQLAQENNIPIIIDYEIEELSKYIGKENKAIIGIKESNLAKEILKKYNGGDIIG